MNWFFVRPPAPSETCDRVQPLLSLLADGMASRAEARRARLHLETCADCRRAWAWMQATHDVLATREPAAVPAELRGRCRRAWAAEDALAPPVRRIPARSRVLRPAFAAALSLVAVGVVAGHYLAPAPPAAVQPVTPPVPVAVNPRQTLALPAATHHTIIPQKLAAKPRHETGTVPVFIRPTETPRRDTVALGPPAPVKRTMPRMKTDVPALMAKQPLPIVRKALPAPQIAARPKPRPELTPVSHETPPAQMATRTPGTPTPAPPVQMAVVPKQNVPTPQTAEYVAPPHADPLGAVRVQLASINTTVARKLAMNEVVHLPPSFVQADFVHGNR